MLPIAFRAPMRSRLDDVDPGLAVERALDVGVCGTGGRLAPAPGSLEEALGLLSDAYDDRFARRVSRFADAPLGAFVWTRDADGLLHLGRVTGPWAYDAAPAAHDVDLVHVRPCRWLPAPLTGSAVPPAVRHAFARGGRNWQRINDPTAGPASAAAWEHGSAGRA